MILKYALLKIKINKREFVKKDLNLSMDILILFQKRYYNRETNNAAFFAIQ